MASLYIRLLLGIGSKSNDLFFPRLRKTAIVLINTSAVGFFANYSRMPMNVRDDQGRSLPNGDDNQALQQRTKRVMDQNNGPPLRVFVSLIC